MQIDTVDRQKSICWVEKDALSKRTPYMRLEMLEHHVRRDLKQHVWDEKDRKRDIWLHSGKMQLGRHLHGESI